MGMPSPGSYARFTIFEIVYVAKTGKEQVPALRDKWIRALADATVMSSGGSCIGRPCPMRETWRVTEANAWLGVSSR